MQRIQAAQPALAKTPLVLSSHNSRRGLIVAAANLAARAAGIRPTMRLSEATALTDVEILEHDPHEDIESLCNVTEQAQQFSPIVGLEQLDRKLWAGRTLVQPECILLDVTGISPLFEGEVGLMESASKWLETQNHFGCMAIGSTIGSAWGIANYATRSNFSPDESEYTNVPKSRCFDASECEKECLQSLPLPALRLEQATVDTLHRLGLRTVGQLEQLPRSGIATRLGEALITRWDQALGKADETVVTLHGSPDWSLEHTLEIPTEDRSTLLELIKRLGQKLSQRLAQRAEGALRIVCRLDSIQDPPIVLQLGLFRPTNDAAHLELLLAGQLEQHLLSQTTKAIWRLCMQATLTAPVIWRQGELFEGGDHANRQQIAQLVDNLSARLGRKQVLSAKIKRESQPELACTLHPMTGRRMDGSEQETYRKLSSRISRGRAEPAREDPLRRPTQLYQPPIETKIREAENSLGEQTGQRNLQFKHQGTWHEVVETVGPERLESGWWKGPSSRRDYYRFATRHGSWWWLFRDLNNNRWYIHGAFD